MTNNDGVFQLGSLLSVHQTSAVPPRSHLWPFFVDHNKGFHQ
jgi:hypothetical protein